MDDGRIGISMVLIGLLAGVVLAGRLVAQRVECG
jgi:hypothetical protein